MTKTSVLIYSHHNQLFENPMEGISQSRVLTAPTPTTPFESFVIESLQRSSRFEVAMVESINDLSESIAYVANVTVTKEEFESRIGSIEGIMATKEDLKGFATKDDLKREIGAAEHRIKSYIDDKVVTQNVMPTIQAEDKKINCVIDSLEEVDVLSRSKVEYLKQQGPFPHLA